jgi:hypothetical protein
MAYYSAMKKSKNISFSGQGMELEVITLSEMSQTEEAKHRRDLLHVEFTEKNYR